MGKLSIVLSTCYTLPPWPQPHILGKQLHAVSTAFLLGEGEKVISMGRAPEEDVVSHASILAWRISMDIGTWRATVHGGCRVGHDSGDCACVHAQ